MATSNEKPIIGITVGDINGIGPEIIIKALSDNRILNFFTPVIYSSEQALTFTRKVLDLKNFNYQVIKDASQANGNKVYVVPSWQDELRIEFGLPTQASGKAAIYSLQKAAEDLKENKLDAIVTAPLHKKNISDAGFPFTGHTEFFADKFASKSLMFLVADELKVGIATAHIALNEVSSTLSKELIVQKLKLMHRSLITDFSIHQPRIAVMGLNPHAGEEGMMGQEEKNVIEPAIKEARENNILAFGPFPSDGFFGTRLYKEYDAILCMYHDQGLIPFKTLCFETGVNFTAGLPVIRTSPDHGTAYSIAGKNKAEPSSFMEALFTACKIWKNRKLHNELTKNQLQAKRVKEKES